LAEDTSEGDDLGGWLRIAASVLGVSLFPVWLVLTAVVAETWWQGEATTVMITEGGEIVEEPGIPVLARLLVAGAVAGGAVLAVLGAVGLVATLALLVRGALRREAPPAVTGPTSGPTRGALRVRRSGVGAEQVPPKGAAPPVATPPAPEVAPPAPEVGPPAPKVAPPASEVAPPTSDDEVDRLFQR
jgi:hypothetical protein